MTQVRRRQVLISAGVLLAAPQLAFAQPDKIPRIGFLISETLSGEASRIEALRAGLRDFGYVEGKNIAIELRPADGNYDRLPALAAELVRLKVDVLVAFGAKAVLSARGATTTIPIVVPVASDPVAMGIADSLARPGRNVTGATAFIPELHAKRLELLREVMPGITRVAVLVNPATPSSRRGIEASIATGKSLKLELQAFEMRSPKEFGSAFSAMAKARIDAIVVSADTLFRAHAKEIAGLAAKRRLPLVGTREFAEVGALIGYGANNAELYRRAAYFVDKILKGAKPGDLPIEQPTNLELVINMKTAKALGLTIPQTVLLRATRVIE